MMTLEPSFKSLIFMCLLLIWASFPVLSFAQEDNAVKQLPPSTKTLPGKIPEDKTGINFFDEEVLKLIPDEFIEEAERMEAYCSNQHTMDIYYDCKCVGIRFFEKRVEMGPDIAWETIMDSLSSECHDGTYAAASMYKTCMDIPLMVPDDLDPDEYCSCYAGEYAAEYERKKIRFSSELLSYLAYHANKVCKRRFNVSY